MVFAGGGGKGSYEIGVWKYLHETGLDSYVRAVSGTSVGALNAALFVGSSYELAEKLWLNINQEKILTPREVSAEDVSKWLIANGLNLVTPLIMGVSKLASGVIIGTEKIVQMILTKTRGNHLFSRDGLKEMIYDGLNFDYLRNSEIPCFVTCVRCPGFETERFKLNDYSDADIVTLLLASSAIPFIFPNEEFQGDKYCDGGLRDNVPINPVYDTGVENIIVVHLDRDTIIDREQFQNAKIIEIVPREDLGDALTGTLDFSPEGALYRLNLGYEDAKRMMQPMLDMITMMDANQRMLVEARKKNDEFEKKRQELLNRENDIKNEMANDGFDAVFTELTKGRK